MTLTDALRREYQQLFATCEIRPEKRSRVWWETQRLLQNQARYADVGARTGVPWFLVAVIHSLEAGLNFQMHLHNGDPLTARTVHVPKGRPLLGQPPFTWEVSAVDALRWKALAVNTAWDVASTLFRLEEYNGFGYRKYHPDVLSPYLWSGSNHYRAGKYVQDGLWSPIAASKQIGAAVLLKQLNVFEPAPVTEAPA